MKYYQDWTINQHIYNNTLWVKYYTAELMALGYTKTEIRRADIYEDGDVIIKGQIHNKLITPYKTYLKNRGVKFRP